MIKLLFLYILILALHQVIVISLSVEKRLMITNFHYLSLVHHHYLAGLPYCAEPVGYDDNSPVLKCSAKSLHYLLLIDSVKRVGGFIKKEILLYLVIMSLYPMGIATLIYITYYF